MATTSTVTARVPNALAAALEAGAGMRGSTLGQVMREALEDWVRANLDPEQVQKQLQDLKRQQDEERERYESLAEQALLALQRTESERSSKEHDDQGSSGVTASAKRTQS